MPYKLRKAPKKDLYWVVNKEDGRKFSKEPLPKEDAKAQMRALYAREGGYPKRGGMIAPPASPQSSPESAYRNIANIVEMVLSAWDDLSAKDKIHSAAQINSLSSHLKAEKWEPFLLSFQRSVMKDPKNEENWKVLKSEMPAVGSGITSSRPARVSPAPPEHPRLEEASDSEGEGEEPSPTEASEAIAPPLGEPPRNPLERTVWDLERFQRLYRHDIDPFLYRQNWAHIWSESSDRTKKMLRHPNTWVMRHPDERDIWDAHRAVGEALGLARRMPRGGAKGKGKQSALAKSVMKASASYNEGVRRYTAAKQRFGQMERASRSPSRVREAIAASRQLPALEQDQAVFQRAQQINDEEMRKMADMFEGYGHLRGCGDDDEAEQMRRMARRMGMPMGAFGAPPAVAHPRGFPRPLAPPPRPAPPRPDPAAAHAAARAQAAARGLPMGAWDRAYPAPGAAAAPPPPPAAAAAHPPRPPVQVNPQGEQRFVISSTKPPGFRGSSRSVASEGTNAEETEEDLQMRLHYLDQAIRNLQHEIEEAQNQQADEELPEMMEDLRALMDEEDMIRARLGMTQRPRAPPDDHPRKHNKRQPKPRKPPQSVKQTRKRHTYHGVQHGVVVGGDLNSVGQTIADVGRNVILPGINKVVPGLGTVLQKTGDAITGLFTPQADIDAYNQKLAADAASRAQVEAENQYWASQANAGNPNAALRLPQNASREDVAQAMMMGLGRPRFGAAQYFNC